LRSSARSLDSWITGPSAIGSEKGTPSSIRSAPARTSACITGTVAATPGSPAVMNGISARRRAARSSEKRDRCDCSQRDSFAPGDGVHVLVAAAGQVAQHQRILRQVARQLDRLGDRMRGLQRRQDAFGAGQQMEGGKASSSVTPT
jgi:hypothetical protein